MFCFAMCKSHKFNKQGKNVHLGFFTVQSRSHGSMSHPAASLRANHVGLRFNMVPICTVTVTKQFQKIKTK